MDLPAALHFEFTLADWLAFQGLHAIRRGRGPGATWRRRIALGLMGYALVAALARSSGASWLTVALVLPAWVALFALLILIGSGVAWLRVRSLAKNSDPPFPHRRRVWLTEEFICSAYENGIELRAPWRLAEEPIRAPKHLVVYVGHAVAVVIPRAAFANELEETKLIVAVNQLRVSR